MKLSLVIFRHLIEMALPLIGSRLLIMSTGFISMLMVARLGHQVIAASALANSVTLVLTMAIWSLQFGIGILVGRFFGAKRFAEVGHAVRQCMWLGLFAGLPSAILLWNMAPILLFFGQDKEIVALTTPYFHAFAWGIVPSMWVICQQQFIVGISEAALVTIWSLIFWPLSVALTYALIFGKWGCPYLGLTGVGVASSIGFWSAFLYQTLWLACRKKYKPYRLLHLKSWRALFQFNYLRELLSFGIFTSMQITAEVFAYSVSTIFMGWFGERALAGQQIVLQISNMLLMFPYAFSQASGVLISQAAGSGRERDIRSIGHMALFLGGVLGVASGLCYLLFPKVIISFYIDIHDIAMQPTVKLTIVLLAVAAISQFFDILRTIASGSLRGLFDTKVPMFVSVFISCLTSLPIGYILAYSFHLGAIGVRLGFVVSFFVGAVVLIYRFQRLSHEELLEARLLKQARAK